MAMLPKRCFLAFFLSLVALILAGWGAEEGGSPGDVATAAEDPSCSVEALRDLPDVRLTSITEETAPVPHCKVAGVIGTETHFELLLPEAWNGKFAMGGGGGFGGVVTNTALMYGALQKGYATVGTDTGHAGHPLDASWAYNNLERLVSFGHQAVHRTAVTSKVLIADYYNADISRSYFTGCSAGGGQGFTEAQRYPEDFDGIVAGSPAYDWVGIVALASPFSTIRGSVISMLARCCATGKRLIAALARSNLQRSGSFMTDPGIRRDGPCISDSRSAVKPRPAAGLAG
jgi:hypothetical protein